MTSRAVASLHAEVNRLRHEIQTLKVDSHIPEAGEQVYIGQYLLERLAQLGVTVCPCSQSRGSQGYS